MLILSSSPTPLLQPPKRPRVESSVPHAHGPDVLREGLVEAPHVLLEMSHLHDLAPLAADVAHVGVAALASVRAAQLFGKAGWESKLEGVSSAALAVSASAGLLPGGFGHAIAEGAHVGHGLLEVGLGTAETVAALREQKSWQTVAHGGLGVLKGLAVLTPFVLPGLEHVAHLVELGTLAGRAGLQAHAG